MLARHLGQMPGPFHFAPIQFCSEVLWGWARPPTMQRERILAPCICDLILWVPKFTKSFIREILLNISQSYFPGPRYLLPLKVLKDIVAFTCNKKRTNCYLSLKKTAEMCLKKSVVHSFNHVALYVQTSVNPFLCQISLYLSPVFAGLPLLHTSFRFGSACKSGRCAWLSAF